MVQPVSRSVEEVNRLECFIRTKVQLFLLGLGQAKGRFHPSPSSKHRGKPALIRIRATVSRWSP